MSRSGTRTLSTEDRILWSRVARTAVPLRGREQPASEEGEEPATGDRPAPEAKRAPVAQRAVGRDAGSAPGKLDLPTRKKLAKGRLPIEGTVDLHGLTQGEAHALLLAFLHRAHADGRRHVLIITGKGESYGSDGVLRRAVPAWLATAPFRALVSGQEAAGRRHGGGGALYVRLRRHGEGGRK